jgi:hypothetical protein
VQGIASGEEENLPNRFPMQENLTSTTKKSEEKLLRGCTAQQLTPPFGLRTLTFQSQARRSLIPSDSVHTYIRTNSRISYKKYGKSDFFSLQPKIPLVSKAT